MSAWGRPLVGGMLPERRWRGEQTTPFESDGGSGVTPPPRGGGLGGAARLSPRGIPDSATPKTIPFSISRKRHSIYWCRPSMRETRAKLDRLVKRGGIPEGLGGSLWGGPLVVEGPKIGWPGPRRGKGQLLVLPKKKWLLVGRITIYEEEGGCGDVHTYPGPDICGMPLAPSKTTAMWRDIGRWTRNDHNTWQEMGCRFFCTAFRGLGGRLIGHEVCGCLLGATFAPIQSMCSISGGGKRGR